MPTEDLASTATPDSRELRREVARVRRRARAVLFAGAAVAALAADVWYEIFTFGIWWHFNADIYFPLFFFVAFAVFAAAAARRTAEFPLSVSLDDRFSLKERLASASRFERLSRVPQDLREAQARETLRAVDFGRLRSSYRLRPWGALAVLAAGCGIVALLMHRFPEVFNPNNLVFRHGRIVFMAAKNLQEGGTRGNAGSPGDSSRQVEDGHPQVALVPKQEPPPPAPLPATQPDAPGQKPPEATEPEKKPPSHPETSPARPSPAEGSREKGEGTRLGPNEGGAFGRSASLEETGRITPPTTRPESGLAVGAANLRENGAGPSLPPLPFVRLLGGGKADGVLFDPETLNIDLEAAPPKYREHLESYLKALQTLREDRDGS